MSDFRISVRTPGDGESARLHATEEQGVLNGDPGQGIGGMSELEARADIARGEDTTVRRLKTIIDGNALFLVIFDSGGIKAQSLNVRRASDADENGVGPHLAVSFQVQHSIIALRFGSDDTGIQDQPHAIAFQLDAVRFQYACFFETFVTTGLAKVLAPKPFDSPCQ